MNPYPKHYLADVPQELRQRLLDLCSHWRFDEALNLLHEHGFTHYEFYEVTWFYWHAPTNLPAPEGVVGQSVPAEPPPSPLSGRGQGEDDGVTLTAANLNGDAPTLTPDSGTVTPSTQTLTPPDLNHEPRTGNAEPLALTPLRELCLPRQSAATAGGSVVKSSRPVKAKRRKPRSKACQLPKDIQDNLNTLLAAGRPYAEIIHWLSDRGYAGFNKVNLHNWRITGFQNWLREQKVETEAA